MNVINKLIINYILYINIFFIYVLLVNVSYAQDSVFKTFYFPNGGVSSLGYLVNNLPSGQWINYHENGKVKSVGFWKNNALDSNWVFYNTSGQKVLEENYVSGKKHGNQTKYDSLGIIKITHFYQGKKDGLEVFYFSGLDSLKYQESNYVNNKKDGKSYEYDTSGNIITIINYNMGLLVDKKEINRYDKNGKKHGRWISFYPNKKIKKEETYQHGVLNGISKTYNKKGGIKEIENYEKGKEAAAKINLDITISAEKTENNGKREGIIFQQKKQGLFKVYDSTGKLKHYEFYNNNQMMYKGMYDSLNLKSGEWTYFDQKNNIINTGYYTSNKKDKTWTYYYPNGVIQQKGSYILGKPTGEWTWWYNNNQLWRKEQYEKGKINGLVIEYDSLGKIITKGEYLYGQKEGVWYYEINDHKEEGEFVSDMKNGSWEMTYLSSNQKMFSGKYLNDIPVGEHIYYYPNGVIKEIGKYENGEKEGEWKKYNNDGVLLVTYYFKRGVEFKRDGLKIK